MSRVTSRSLSVVGRRKKALREDLQRSREKVGFAIGIDESSSRARISRYEIGVHEPPIPTAQPIADALSVPLTYLYCDDDHVAALLLALHRPGSRERGIKVRDFLVQLA
jgi:transcriptional regulator with XRE-family HTH domain